MEQRMDELEGLGEDSKECQWAEKRRELQQLKSLAKETLIGWEREPRKRSRLSRRFHRARARVERGSDCICCMVSVSAVMFCMWCIGYSNRIEGNDAVLDGMRLNEPGDATSGVSMP